MGRSFCDSWVSHVYARCQERCKFLHSVGVNCVKGLLLALFMRSDAAAPYKPTLAPVYIVSVDTLLTANAVPLSYTETRGLRDGGPDPHPTIPGLADSVPLYRRDLSGDLNFFVCTLRRHDLGWIWLVSKSENNWVTDVDLLLLGGIAGLARCGLLLQTM